MTYQPKSEFLRVIIERGFLADCTDLQELDDKLRAGAQRARSIIRWGMSASRNSSP